MNITILKETKNCPCELCKFVRLAGSAKIPAPTKKSKAKAKKGTR